MDGLKLNHLPGGLELNTAGNNVFVVVEIIVTWSIRIRIFYSAVFMNVVVPS